MVRAGHTLLEEGEVILIHVAVPVKVGIHALGVSNWDGGSGQTFLEVPEVILVHVAVGIKVAGDPKNADSHRHGRHIGAHG